jgi:hypothetical protein
MTLSDGSSGESHRSAEALPTFSTPQFSPVAPVLLPMSMSGPPKWVYPVLGLLGVAIVAVGISIYVVASKPPPGLPPPPPPVPVAAPVRVPAPPAAATPAASKPAEEKPAAEEKSAEKEKEKGRTASSRSHHRGSESSSRGATEGKKGQATATTPTAPSDSASKTSGKTSGGRKGKSLDDLLGDVGTKRSGGGASEESAKPAVKLVTLSTGIIVPAMKAVQPRVQACANQFKVPGTAMANISVAAGGRVSSVKVTGRFAGTPTGSCVESAARAAKFPPCQAITFPWPFTLSPR